MSNWIPVKKELPPKNLIVLATYKNGQVLDFCRILNDGSDATTLILAWQYMPKPFEEDNNE